MEYRILGPLEVLEQGQPRDLGGQKQRALLAALLLEANRVVSSDRLIEALWEEEPPETAQKALQIHVSRLRNVLGRERVETKASGYLLRVEAGELDLERFQRLREEGKFTEALSLWRGTSLADFRYRRFAQAEIARLDEARLACLEDRIELDLAAGRHGDLIGELEALVREHPLRQRLRAQLMLALYRSGRDAEALEAYQDARRLLVEELGIEPRRELRELQQAILRQDPSLDLVEELALAESPRGVFVGREHELNVLRAGLDDALGGRGRLFLLSGEPGIGKSRLAEELIGWAQARGARALIGRCWEAGGAPAYWPWLHSLRAYLRETEAQALRRQLGAGAPDLAQLLPELRELFPDLPEPPELEPESARFRLFEAASSFLKSAAEARPLLLVLDDLHAADEPSLLLLQFLARELGESRLLVLGAYRDVDPTIGDPLSAALAELAREPVTRTLALPGLEEGDVARFIERISGEVPGERFVAAIHEETQGNPLFIGEIVRLLAAERRLDEVDATPLVIPQSVRDVIARRLRHLTEECNRLLVLASVLGREFPLDLLARLGSVSEEELLDAMDDAFADRVVSDVPGSPEQLRFAHALIRDTLYEGLTTARRVRLHRLAVEALENLYGDDPGPRLAELAYHSIAGSDFDRGLEYARLAGDRASDLLAFEEAVRLYQAALDAGELTELKNDARCDLLIRLADVQARAGDMPAARRSFVHAAELASEIGSSEMLTRAALGYGGRFLFTRATEDDRIVPLLEQAADALGQEESPLRVRVLTRLANALSQHAPESSEAFTAEALELARRLNDPDTLAYAIAGRIWATRAPTDLDERLTLTSELIEAGDKERAFEGHILQYLLVGAQGNVPRMRTQMAIAAQMADELGQPSQHWWVAAHGAQLALLEGRLADAEELIDRAHTLGARAQSYDAPIYFQLQRFALRREQGRLAEVLTDLEQTAARDPARRLLRCVLALACWELGEEEQARGLFDDLAADGFAELPVNNDWLLSAALLAELTASAADAERADALYRRLSPFDGLNVDTAEVSTGAVSRYLGLLAAARGQMEEAERHFEDALEMNERMGARPWLAHTQRDYGRMLAERGETKRASELVASAIATYRELGMESYATTSGHGHVHTPGRVIRDDA